MVNPDIEIALYWKILYRGYLIIYTPYYSNDIRLGIYYKIY